MTQRRKVFNEEVSFLNAALLCEKALQEKDETVSIIRTIDRITLTTQAMSSPETLPPVPIALYAFISLKSGNARGKHVLKWITEAPSGIRSSEQLLPGHWNEPIQAFTEQWACYIAGLMHQDSRLVIKVVRFGLNILCLPDEHAVELVEKQIARQKQRCESEDDS